MDSSKKIRTVFAKVDAPRPETANFYQLTVNGQVVRNVTIGVDQGAVFVSPGPGAGAAPYKEGAIVTLTATPGAGYNFESWSGGCGGKGPCIIAMNSDQSVTATFSPQRAELSTAVNPADGGTISPRGTTSYKFKSVVTIIPEPAESFRFQAWSGDCTGNDECNVMMDANRSVTALFAPMEWVLAAGVTPPDSGTVSPAESFAYQHGSQIAVTAAPAQGFEFGEWSGDCEGNGACELTMDRDKAVTAVFVPMVSPTVTQ